VFAQEDFALGWPLVRLPRLGGRLVSPFPAIQNESDFELRRFRVATLAVVFSVNPSLETVQLLYGV